MQDNIENLLFAYTTNQLADQAKFMTDLPPTRYRIAAIDPCAHLFEVHCTVVDPDPDGQAFRLPVWIPGSYLVREFARHFVSVRAETSEGAVNIVKAAKDCWRLAPCSTPLTVVAKVYAFDLSVRAAYLDSSRGYFNGSAVFLCPEGRANRRCLVEIATPPANVEGDWRVATSLTPRSITAAGFGSYSAENYDELIDHPVEMSDFASAAFEAGGVRHEIALSGRQRADRERLTRDLARICQWHCDLFGGAPDSPAPFLRYLFQVAVVGDGYGGLEHRSGTSLLCRRDDLPQPGAGAIGEDYRRFLGLASHEYFHAWNVKRIKPAAFLPYDLGRENYTRQLWAFEGITSYYDDLALLRSGVIDAASYLELLGRTISAVLRNPGRHLQSVAESSFDAWIKYYRQDENTPNAVVSYYAKGSLVALALDLTLRQRGSSLDSLLRLLWTRYGQTGVGVPEDGIAALACELGGPDLGDFFARYVNGTDELPLAELLASVGVVYRLRAATGANDEGGKPAVATSPRATLGVKIGGSSEVKLLHVYNNGAAERAGLAAGDIVVAIDGLRASADAIERLLTQRRAGEALTLHAFRRDELRVVTLTLDAAPEDRCWLTLADDLNVEALAARAAWLSLTDIRSADGIS